MIRRTYKPNPTWRLNENELKSSTFKSFFFHNVGRTWNPLKYILFNEEDIYHLGHVTSFTKKSSWGFEIQEEEEFRGLRNFTIFQSAFVCDYS